MCKAYECKGIIKRDLCLGPSPGSGYVVVPSRLCEAAGVRCELELEMEPELEPELEGCGRG